MRLLELDLINRGEKLSGYLEVPQTQIKLPITVIRGESGDRVLLITGGVHSAEYVGIQTAIQLAASLKPEDVNGYVMIIPTLNPSGFKNRTMSVVFEDQCNLNRVFPGNNQGSVSEKIAAFVVEHLFEKIHYFIDLHGGDGFESLTPYVYYPGVASKEVVSQSLAMAKRVQVPYRVKSKTASGGAYNHAASMGIPSILMERGQLSLWSESEVHAMVRDVKGVMSEIEMVRCPENTMTHTQIEFESVDYLTVKETGFWYPHFLPGDGVTSGSCLGEIRDCFGAVIESIYASSNGILLYQVGSLNIREGEVAVAYGIVV